MGFKPDLDDQLVSFSALTWFGLLACKNSPRDDLQCVEWDVKSVHFYYWMILECVVIESESFC